MDSAPEVEPDEPAPALTAAAVDAHISRPGGPRGGQGPRRAPRGGPRHARRGVAAAAPQDPEPLHQAAARSHRDRRRRTRPGGFPGRPRRGHPPGGSHGGSHRDPLRARTRSRGQGGPGDEPGQGHRLRHGLGRRPHPGPHSREVGHRRRGPEPASPTGHPGRRPGLARGPRGHPSPRGRPRPRHRRARRHGQPGRDAPHPDLGGHRGGQVVVHQLAHHLDPDARHTGTGPPHPGRPQAGRARPVQRPAPPPHPGGGGPEEGGQRALVGGDRDGTPLRHPGRSRNARHRRLQPGPGVRGARSHRRGSRRRTR